MIDVDYLSHVRPSARQLAWQALEYYGFIHFGMNTMTGREWGTGREDPALFSPAALDADQWAATAKASGMRGLILTCKHHDGFCLWPSRLTRHSVAASPWRAGQGDVVAEVAAACRRFGLAFGIYLSPWDMASPLYGQGAAYDDYFVGQLTELLTGYGDIFCVWLDGACGEGANGKRQVYDWDRYIRTVRALRPHAVVSVCGPDVRWCGNEAGHTRPAEWSVVPHTLRDAERTAARSQQTDDAAFARLVRTDDQDLGSRDALARAVEGTGVGQLVWYPAEVNTSIRPGWFYHPQEDGQVRGAHELFSLYLSAVGGNSTLLLNVPPTPDGRIAEPDRRALVGLGARIAELDAARLGDLTVTCSSTQRGDQGGATGDGTMPGGRWMPHRGDTSPWIGVDLGGSRRLRSVVVREDIRVGQRVEDLVVSGWTGTQWTVMATAPCVGYQRIIPVEPTPVERVRFSFRGARGRPAIASVGLLAA